MASVMEKESIHRPSMIILAIFGYHNKVTSTDNQEHTLTPMLQELERLPDIILLPSEGNSSIYVADWAESLHIKTQVFQSDWARNGKVAQRIRDEHMQKECTHALVYLSNRSDRLEKYAELLAKKGKIVFTSSSNQTLQMLTCPEPQVAMPEPLKKASTSARKSSKGTMQTLLKFQTTK
jgi:hypothetical protein